MQLPPLCDRVMVRSRLSVVFPEGTPNRNYCIRDAAAATVFTMLYVGAVEGSGAWVAPKQIVRMSNTQAARTDDAARRHYASESARPGFKPEGSTWYLENSREQIRDETIRQGLIPNNAVIEREGIPTTSSRPRYALQAGFASLFDPSLTKSQFGVAARRWQQEFLSVTALARTALVRRGAEATDAETLVTFPGGETRRMAPGPSTFISKSVIETFSRQFLVRPAVLFLSESSAKIVHRDDELAQKLHLKINAERNLPDIILVDLGKSGSDGFMLMFVEVVATDGPVTERRREALLSVATDAGFPQERVAFMTAFIDRSHVAFKRCVSELAWGTFVWFATEPDKLIALVRELPASSKAQSLLRRFPV